MAEQLRDWLGNLPAFVGDLPTWIAVAAAIYAGVHAGRLLKIENKRDREREKRDEQRDMAERSQQANLVAAWRGVVPAHPDVPGSDAGTYGPVVRNASELPIYQVNVEIVPIGVTGGAQIYVYEVLPPGQWFVHVEDQGFYATRPVVLHPGLRGVPEYQVAVSFRDAAGNVWKRDVNGHLRQTGRVVFAQMTATLPGLVGRAHGGPVQATGRRHPWFPRRKAPPS